MRKITNYEIHITIKPFFAYSSDLEVVDVPNHTILLTHTPTTRVAHTLEGVKLFLLAFEERMGVSTLDITPFVDDPHNVTSGEVDILTMLYPHIIFHQLKPDSTRRSGATEL